MLASGGTTSDQPPAARVSEICTLKVATAAGSRGQVTVLTAPTVTTGGLAVKVEPVWPMKYSTPLGMPSLSKSRSAAWPPALADAQVEKPLTGPEVTMRVPEPARFELAMVPPAPVAL